MIISILGGAILRVKYFDILKSISIIGVLTIHVSANLVDNFKIGSYNWWVGNVYDSIARICIPIFFMVSGALLLNSKKSYSLKEFYSNKVFKLFISFLIWSIVYFIQRNSQYPESFNVKNFVIQFATGGIFNRLWFFYTLLGLYIVAPFLNIFVNNATLKYVRTFLLVWFLSTTFTDFLSHFFNIELKLELSYVYGYIGYFVLGYYLSKINFKLNKKIGVAFILSLFSLCVFGTYILSVIHGENNLYLYNNLSPNTIILATITFLVIRDCFKGQSTKVVSLISSNSLGIYVIHTFVLNYLNRIGFVSTFVNPILAVPILVIVTFFISFTLSNIIKKIPIINKAIY